MTPLLLTLAYCVKDAERAKSLLKWMGELGGPYPTHSILLAADNVVDMAIKSELHAQAKDMFGHVETMMVDVPANKQGWPLGANCMFHQVSRQVMECFRQPFLWLEPDCTPTKPSWLLELQDAYYASPKRLMGCFVASNQVGMPRVYLPGCSIYPNDVYNLLAKSCERPGAWDIESAALTIPRAKNTALIQDFFGEMDLPPTFVLEKTTDSPKNALPLSFIRPEAVLFHRCKDGSLIDLLRSKRESSPEPVKRGPGRPRKTEPVTTKPKMNDWEKHPDVMSELWKKNAGPEETANVLKSLESEPSSKNVSE